MSVRSVCLVVCASFVRASYRSGSGGAFGGRGVFCAAPRRADFVVVCFMSSLARATDGGVGVSFLSENRG